ncbi:unnamed protein product [Staurois parvus]|uniref:DUF4440 domain-containing protein n=1 Tax=Staurois parvus TaxID=386267 RepID=A0ABN9ATF5_9NEOB|nr:unnamed protein product [Staurois parvus]
MQMSAVDLRITAHFTHLGQSRGPKPECGATVWRWRQQQWEAMQHPMTKMETTSSVRRPESGTWQSVAIETAAMGGRTGTHDTLWTWQQHEEAYRGPWQITGLAAA